MLGQVVSSMKFLPTCFAAKLFILFMLPGMPKPVIFPHKLTATMIASIRFNGFVRIHVGDKIRLPDEST